jgi:hypothetical protein
MGGCGITRTTDVVSPAGNAGQPTLAILESQNGELGRTDDVAVPREKLRFAHGGTSFSVCLPVLKRPACTITMAHRARGVKAR